MPGGAGPEAWKKYAHLLPKRLTAMMRPWHSNHPSVTSNVLNAKWRNTTVASLKVAVVGGSARSLINFRGPLLEAMVSAGHTVTACAPQLTPDIVDALQAIGVNSHEIPLDRTGINPKTDMLTLTHLRSLFLQLRPDVVLAYTIKPVIYASFAGKSARVPRISSMITGLGYSFGASSIKQRMLGRVARTLYKRALRANCVVFFQNPDDLSFLIEQGILDDPQKAVLINGSGVDLSHFKKVPVVTSPLTFLLIARLIRDKGIFEFVEAAKIIKTKYPNTRFCLVGPFDSNPSAIPHHVIAKWQSEGIIEYMGATKDVRPFIASASVYVLPSYREGTPRTVLEAMAMGRPIITTDAPGCKETVIHGYNGYLVPVRDSHSLAKAIEQFILHPELIPRMGEASYKVAVDKYDVKKVNAVIMTSLGL